MSAPSFQQLLQRGACRTSVCANQGLGNPWWQRALNETSQVRGQGITSHEFREFLPVICTLLQCPLWKSWHVLQAFPFHLENAFLSPHHIRLERHFHFSTKKKKRKKVRKATYLKIAPPPKKKQKNPVDIFLLSTDGSAALSWTDIIVNLSQGCSLYQPVS